MRLSNWIALGLATALAAACGGSVSLGDLGGTTAPDASTPSDGSVDGKTEGGSAVLCASPTECGPGPRSPAINCPDGSLGGNTGRCIQSGSGCEWENRACPPTTCFDTAGTLDPTLSKCTLPTDCVVVLYQRDCCGSMRATGVASTSKAAADKCASARAASLPQCDCLTQPTAADDGSTDTGAGGTASVTCSTAGRCETSFKTVACGTATCKPGQICCSGIPFPSPTCIDGGGGCPVSQRKHKKDITYLSEADRERLRDELVRFPLATYRYKSESAEDREHLGFIIDDVAPSPAVMQSGERVDMYGYQTMTVAALQVQARELASLRRELDELKASCAKPAPGTR